MEELLFMKEEIFFPMFESLDEYIDADLLFERSFETTLSANENQELENIEEFTDLESMFTDDIQIIANKLVEEQGAIEIPFAENISKGIECFICNLYFSNFSNLSRHFGSKKHQRLEAGFKNNLMSTTISNDSTLFKEEKCQVIQDGQSSSISVNIIDLTKDIDSSKNHDTGSIRNDEEFVQEMRDFIFDQNKFLQKPSIYKSPLENSSQLEVLPTPMKCRFCPKKFSTCSNLRRHENLHIPVKLFPCHICPKKFKQREYLKKHLFTHTHGKRAAAKKLKK